MSGANSSRIFSVTTLGWDQDDVAKSIMKFLVQRIEPILKHRGWLIGVLKEFYPRGASLLGLNYDKGKEVCIRLRVPGDKTHFLPFHEVLCTTLHEVAHCEFSKHDKNFWNLYYQLVKDCEKMELSLIERGVPLYPPHVGEQSPPEKPQASARGTKRPRPVETATNNAAVIVGGMPQTVPMTGEGHRLGGRAVPVSANGGSAASEEQRRRRLLAEAALRRMQKPTRSPVGQQVLPDTTDAVSDTPRGTEVLPDEIPLSLTPKKESDWICPRCTFENTAANKECAMCSDDVGDTDGGDTASDTIMMALEQPWSCTACTFLNVASATECAICQTPREGGTNHAAIQRPSVVVVDDDDDDEDVNAHFGGSV